MYWTNVRRVLIACSAAALLAAPGRDCAACPLFDWMFGNGQTTYAPPYSPPTVTIPGQPGCSCAPATGACGCAPACSTCPSCPTCTRGTTYRISYRPVATVAYMPVVGIDPRTGCAVTTYRPTRAWTYQANLVPYQAGCDPAVPGGGCSSCGAAYGGCSSCGSTYGGCSSCNTGISSGYLAPGGSPSYTSSPAPLLPGPADMSRPPLGLSPTIAPSPTAPGTNVPLGGAFGPAEPARTYAPGTTAAPIAPGTPGGASTGGVNYPGLPPSEGARTVEPPKIQNVPGVSTGSANYLGLPPSEGVRTVEPPKIQNIPPVPGTSQPSPPRNVRPGSEDATTARPVLQATYFRLLESPPAAIPAQMISAPSSAPTQPSTPQPAYDGGWQHVDR